MLLIEIRLKCTCQTSMHNQFHKKIIQKMRRKREQVCKMVSEIMANPL